MLELSPQILTILVFVALALAALALFILAVRAPRRPQPVSEERPPSEILEDHDRSLEALREAVRQLAEEQRRHAEVMLGFVQRTGLVRFDAFDDMSGQLSFSAALLDAHGEGVVITSINGRQDTRCYAKSVRGGSSQHNLSVEERQAIERALAGPQREPAAAAPPPRPGRRLRRGA